MLINNKKNIKFYNFYIPIFYSNILSKMLNFIILGSVKLRSF